MPSENTIKIMGLRQSCSYPVRWVNSNNGSEVFFYEAWGNATDDSRQKEYIYDGDVVSDGHRLKISSHFLKQYLTEVGFDLILEVEITRRVSKDGITSYDPESEKAARYTRLYLFRETGEIFTAEGCAGTWAPLGN